MLAISIINKFIKSIQAIPMIQCFYPRGKNLNFKKIKEYEM